MHLKTYPPCLWGLASKNLKECLQPKGHFGPDKIETFKIISFRFVNMDFVKYSWFSPPQPKDQNTILS
jgi:hypothetical protein